MCSNGVLQSLHKPIPIREPLRHILNLKRDSIVASLASERFDGPSMLPLPVRTLP